MPQSPLVWYVTNAPGGVGGASRIVIPSQPATVIPSQTAINQPVGTVGTWQVMENYIDGNGVIQSLGVVGSNASPQGWLVALSSGSLQITPDLTYFASTPAAGLFSAFYRSGTTTTVSGSFYVYDTNLQVNIYCSPLPVRTTLSVNNPPPYSSRITYKIYENGVFLANRTAYQVPLGGNTNLQQATQYDYYVEIYLDGVLVTTSERVYVGACTVTGTGTNNGTPPVNPPDPPDPPIPPDPPTNCCTVWTGRIIPTTTWTRGKSCCDCPED